MGSGLSWGLCRATHTTCLPRGWQTAGAQGFPFLPPRPWPPRLLPGPPCPNLQPVGLPHMIGWLVHFPIQLMVSAALF